MNCDGSYSLVILTSALVLLFYFYYLLPVFASVLLFSPLLFTICCNSLPLHGRAVEASHFYGSHLLGGQFWSAPVENPREMSSDCQNLGDAAAFALLRLLHQVFAKNNCRGSSVAPQRQGSNQGLCSVSSFYSFTLPASLCTTFDRNNCRLIML